MKLGTLLLRDGVITLEQLEAALRSQVLFGGKLGSNLVELGHLSLDTLTTYLERAVNVPAATEAHLEAAEPEAITAIDGDTAWRCLAFPLGWEDGAGGGRVLAVAMADPTDLDRLAELEAAAKAGIRPYVAPELRVEERLRRHWPNGAPSPATRSSRPARTEIQHPIPPPRAPRDLPPAPPRDTVKAPITARPKGPPPPDSTPKRTVSRISDIGPPARPPPMHRPLRTSAHVIPRAAGDSKPTRPIRIPPRLSGPASPPVSIGETLTRLEAARSRDEIGDELVRFARGRVDAAVLFLVKDGRALGWKGFGGESGSNALDALVVAVDPPSPLAGPFRDRKPWRGRLADVQNPDELVRMVGTGDTIIAPVVIGAHVVNLFYGCSRQLDEGAADALESAVAAAGEAYARLLSGATARS